jgi:opacity protein-like surface antigen
MTRVIVVIAVALAVAPGARADVYIRPLVEHVSATNVSVDGPKTDASRFCGGIAVGCCFGGNDEVDLGLEFSSCKLTAPSYETYSGKYPYGRSFQNTDSLQIQPYLATGRYRFGSKATRARPYAGLVVGLTDLTAHSIAKGTNSPTMTDSSGSGTYVTVGGLVGIQIRLIEQVDLDVGYRYCQISSSHLTAANVNTSVAYAGIGFRF